MELHQLEQFKTIAECRTMREAADKLYLSQSALSQNLKKLESELGCLLFDRSHNQLTLTPYGEILLAHTHRILFDLKEVYDKIEEKKQQEASLVRIGGFYMPLNLIAFPQIANAMPDLQFEVTTGKSNNLSKELINRKLDLAFLPSQFCPAHLESEPYYEESLLLSVMPSSPLSKREFIDEMDLRQAPILIPADFSGLTQWYEEALAEAEVSPMLIQKVPAKEYLETMDTTERAHFTTSFMSLFSSSKDARVSIPVKSGVSPRMIAIAYDGNNERVTTVLDYIVDKKDELVSNHAFLPFLIYQNATSNLSMRFEP